ncbi:MAG: DUF5698 domain-containing protein [Bacilli bacterium]|nr:DUF5698 domain-containing protein [Bacilli bacterium]MDD4298870.1 DUF5698 domain-containing protein [Bacilli bacterium]MDD4643505.1 DUF5698 domain-containing protein [Bacilli bacterium]
MSLFLNCLLIFVVRIIDVSMGTLRTVLVVRGKRMVGAFIGFIEVGIWFLVVRQALTGEDTSLWVAIAYAGGFSTGTFVGSWLEEKLAIGSSSVTVVTRGLRHDVVKTLRDKGFGVSSVISQGIDEENLMLIIEVDRKRINEVCSIIKEIAPDSFIAISDTKRIINGYFR